MSTVICTACAGSAGWTCAMCGPRCVEHVRRKRERALRFGCSGCGGLAELLRVRRSERTSFRERLQPTLLLPLRGRALLGLVFLALLLSSSVLFGGLAWGLGLAPLLLLAMRQLDAVADDEPLDWPSLSEATVVLGRAFLRGFVTFIPILMIVFFGVYEGVVVPWLVEAERSRSLALTLFLSPGFWLSSLVSVAWFPVALVGASMAESWWQGLEPRLAIRWLRRFPREWAVMCGLIGTAFVVTFFLKWIFTGWLGALVSSLVIVYGVLGTASLAGMLVWLQPEVFGWGREDEAWLELGDPEAPKLEEAPVQAQPPHPGRLNTSLEGQLAAALDAKDVTLALRLYSENTEAAQHLSPAVLLRLGQAAASKGEYALAMEALLGGARGSDEHAQKSLVIAARILDERLRDYVGAKKLYEQVVQRFPQTQAAAYALRQLAEQRFISPRAS